MALGMKSACLRVAMTVTCAMIGAIGISCSQGITQCECLDPAAHVQVPAESAASVMEIELSGPACEGTLAKCVKESVTGCAEYAFTARAAGQCKVDVIFTSGTFSTTVAFSAPNSCCTGFYPQPASAGEIDASRPLSDAGGAE